MGWSSLLVPESWAFCKHWPWKLGIDWLFLDLLCILCCYKVQFKGCTLIVYINVIQALMRCNYFNYHRSNVDNFSDVKCRFCQEVRKELIHLAWECPTLAREHLDSVHGLQLSTQPSDRTGLVRLTKVDCIAIAMAGKVYKAEYRRLCTTNGNIADGNPGLARVNNVFPSVVSAIPKD